MQLLPFLLLVANLEPHNVKIEEVTFKGRAAIRLTDTAPPGLVAPERLAILKNSSFTDGIMEFDFAGDRLPAAPDSARGFTGLAFRVGPGGERYNAFYLRPYNGRSPQPGPTQPLRAIHRHPRLRLVPPPREVPQDV